MKNKIKLYVAMMSGEKVYRKYYTDKQAISAFKRISYRNNSKLTDISVKIENGLSRLNWN